jgi:hypothetical protein
MATPNAPRLHTSRNQPDQEARGYEHDLDHRDVLEHEGVEERQGQVAGHRRGQQRLGDQQAERQADGGAPRAEHDRVLLRQGAGGHRAVALAGVQAVPFRVHHVVDEVHRGRGEAEGGRGGQGVEQAVATAERRAGQRGGEHEQVLGPLPGPGGAHHRDHPAQAPGVRGYGHLSGARLSGHRE